MAPSGRPFLGLQGNALTWAITLCSASAFLLFGYDQGIMGSIISTPYFLEAINLKATDTDTISTIVSIYDIGCMVGCLMAAIWGGIFGRKLMIHCGMVIMGIGNGLNTATVPTWVAETSKAKYRGRLVATQLSIAAFGIVIAYWMNYGFFHAHGQIVWRFPIGFQTIFAIVTVIALFFLPESPRWLYSKGRTEEADVVLAALKALSLSDEVIQIERSEILEAIAFEDQSGEFSWATVFWDKSGQKISYRILLGFIIQMIQQLPGVNIVIYYSSTVFLNLGLPAKTALVLGGIASICFWLGSLIGIALIERIGRKKLLISGTIPMLIGYLVYLPMVKNGGQNQLWIAFAMTPWVLGPEIVPVRYRHIGGAMSAGPIGLQNIGWKLYIVFILFTAWQLPIVWFLYPETKGCTLEEIDTLFVKESAATNELRDKAEQVRHLEEKPHHGSAIASASVDDMGNGSEISKATV
ncbi:sugar transporter [Hyaloscypha variabilis]